MPQAQRDDLRERKVDAITVIRLFQFDHIVLHALDGSDRWWNLDPKLIEDHREKSRKDTSIVAKVRRIAPLWQAFTRKMARADKGQPEKKQRKTRIFMQCPLCYYSIRSTNNRYIEVRMAQHMRKAHQNV